MSGQGKANVLTRKRRVKVRTDHENDKGAVSTETDDISQGAKAKTSIHTQGRDISDMGASMYPK